MVGVSTFLKQTYKLIDGCDPMIASWFDEGNKIVIYDSERLASQVIPSFFSHSNYDSFVRQLNFYGFKKCP